MLKQPTFAWQTFARPTFCATITTYIFSLSLSLGPGNVVKFDRFGARKCWSGEWPSCERHSAPSFAPNINFLSRLSLLNLRVSTNSNPPWPSKWEIFAIVDFVVNVIASNVSDVKKWFFSIVVFRQFSSHFTKSWSHFSLASSVEVNGALLGSRL